MVPLEWPELAYGTHSLRRTAEPARKFVGIRLSIQPSTNNVGCSDRWFQSRALIYHLPTLALYPDPKIHL